MPATTTNGGSLKKRKRGGDTLRVSRKALKPSGHVGDEGTHSKILLLEAEIVESRSKYNNIVTLQRYVQHDDEIALVAAVALCRVFCRLIAAEHLVRRKAAANTDAEVVQWLKDRLRDFTHELTASKRWIGSPDPVRESTALTLLMRIVREQVSQDFNRSDQAWKAGVFKSVVDAILSNPDADLARQEFVEKYADQYDDVRFYAFVQLAQKVEADPANLLALLSSIEAIPSGNAVELVSWYGNEPAEGHSLHSSNAHRKTAQEAWLSVFRSTGLSQSHRKILLDSLQHRILPWFTTRVELLADFLTDSFDEGGSLSLLALSGIFHLMTQRNLDYPDFYTKLYSLLDVDVLHSKHRSRFFRQFSLFMNSSHLPAAMMASFIKRLARLALQAPPGAIVWIVPWVYNALRAHPNCSFMLHRPKHPAHLMWAEASSSAEVGMDDPFDMTEANPNATNAIESSLWELETLQSHYHPNVATLAKIMSEQFTKREYILDDFLDHSYASLIEGELARELKKAPEVAWEIPKRIVTTDEGSLNDFGTVLDNAILAL